MAEALMAVALLAAGAVILSTITTNAVTATKVSQDYLIAQNLVTEGLEAVKSVRDTNSLLQPDDRTCWLTLALDASAASCSSYLKATTGRNYLAYNDGSGKWKLVNYSTTPLDVNGVESVQKWYRMHLLNGLYRQSTNLLSGATATKFYRSVTFPTITDSDPLEPGSDSAVVKVEVQWKDGQKVHSIIRNMVLYNYL